MPLTDPTAIADMQALNDRAARLTGPPLTNPPAARYAALTAALGVDPGTLTPGAQRTLVGLCDTDSVDGIIELLHAARNAGPETTHNTIRSEA